VAKQIATLLNVDIEVIADATSRNFDALFSKVKMNVLP
jgi:Tat protein secretion system quality control protein TatD with DNase activity